MNLESIERGLNWLATPKRLPGRLEMETQRGRRLEMEVVSFTIRVPIAGMVVRVPVFILIMPIGTSPIQATAAHAESQDH